MRSRAIRLKKHEGKAICLLVILLLLLPVGIRLFLQGVPPGFDSYHHHRLGEDLLTYGWHAEDMMLPERGVFFSPFHFVLAGVQYLFGDFSFLIVPLLFGLLNVIIIYYLVKQLDLGRLTKMFILLLYVSSPLFLWSSWFLNEFSVLLFFQLLGTLLYLRKDKLRYGSVLFYGIASLFGIVHLLANTFFVVFWSRFKKINPLFYIALGVNALLLVFYHIPRLIFYPSVQMPIQGLEHFLTDLGSISGFSIFLILLFFVGLHYVWRQRKNPILYLIILVLMLHSFFYGSSKIYSNLLFCFFGGIAAQHLLTRRWYLKPIRNLLLLLIGFALLFSSLSFIGEAIHYPPQKSTYGGFSELQHVPEDALVFSLPVNGYWIQGIGGRQAFLDENTIDFPSFDQRSQDMQFILGSYDLEDSKDVLGRNGVSHILLREGDEAPGLRFILQNNETFKKSYDSKDVTIWALSK